MWHNVERGTMPILPGPGRVKLSWNSGNSYGIDLYWKLIRNWFILEIHTELVYIGNSYGISLYWKFIRN